MWAILLEFLEPLGGLLSRLMFSKLGQWIASAMTFLGLSFGTTKFGIGALRDYMQNALTGLPGQLVDWMGVLNLDVYCTIILSAYAAAFVKKVIVQAAAAAAVVA